MRLGLGLGLGLGLTCHTWLGLGLGVGVVLGRIAAAAHTLVGDGGAPVTISSAAAACTSVHSARPRTVMGESLRCDVPSHWL